MPPPHSQDLQLKLMSQISSGCDTALVKSFYNWLACNLEISSIKVVFLRNFQTFAISYIS